MSPPPKKKKLPLSTLLVQQGLADDIAQAKSLVMAGLVYTGTLRLEKPGDKLPEDTVVTVKGRKPHPWVSRGGLKLDHGLKHFHLNPKGWVAADIGASTGGFTDVLLHHGAAKVYAVDVAYGEFAWKLRQDPRVVLLERTNARYLTAKEIPEPLQLVVCDASFIGLQTVLPAVLQLAAPGAYLVALIKPQFEVAHEEVGEKGVVTDPALHQAVCDKIASWLNGLPGWEVLGMTESPILGPEGNKEFLIGAKYRG